MRQAVINLSDLQKNSRWKVEYFTYRSKDLISSRYPLVKLEKIVDQRKESMDPSSLIGAEYNYIGLENIESATGILKNFTKEKGSQIKSRSKIFYKNDVLYGRLRPYLNKVYLASSLQVESGICSNEFIVLIPKSSEVIPRVLRALLSSPFVLESVQHLHTGSSLPRLQTEDLLKIEVPLPPLDDQRKIDKTIFENEKRYTKLLKEVREFSFAATKDFMQSLQ